MRALIRHGQCRIKSDPEPDQEMTSLLNGNVRDPNQVKIQKLSLKKLDNATLKNTIQALHNLQFNTFKMREQEFVTHNVLLI